uniref:Uncharacterized protein n=1 Tax=Kwoniella dejecticola CBS 10117 TaxID=1296121 RepID=A0A1A5ZVF8_9TREE|nr:uncharacterized protein I303_07702 [Kwoniella dejecticola CBS 10117]OBR81792.1 hypothetical protein I303_07702 [Kwoniella dejecticola CBS 10117]
MPCSASTALKFANNASSTLEKVSPSKTPAVNITNFELTRGLTYPLNSDNDAMMGLDPKPRGPLELPAHFKNQKDNTFMCKAHGNASCKSCFNWKKQMTKLHKEGKKEASKKKNEKTTNLY